MRTASGPVVRSTSRPVTTKAKVALDGAWTLNYGVDGKPDGDNYKFTLAADGTVSFVFDPETKILTVTTE